MPVKPLFPFFVISAIIIGFLHTQTNMSLRLTPLPPPSEPVPESNHLSAVRMFLKQGEKIPPMAFASNEEKLAWVRSTLERVDYEHLSRQDKGLVRAYIGAVSGYSRAQVARHIKQYRLLGTKELPFDAAEKDRWI